MRPVVAGQESWAPRRHIFFSCSKSTFYLARSSHGTPHDSLHERGQCLTVHDPPPNAAPSRRQGTGRNTNVNAFTLASLERPCLEKVKGKYLRDAEARTLRAEAQYVAASFDLKPADLDAAKSTYSDWCNPEKKLSVSSAEKWCSSLQCVTARKLDALEKHDRTEWRYLTHFRSDMIMKLYRAWWVTRTEVLAESDFLQKFNDLSGQNLDLREIRNIRETIRTLEPMDTGDWGTKGVVVLTPRPRRAVYIPTEYLLGLAFPDGFPSHWEDDDAALINEAAI
jgi:hypothetical protein